MRRIIHIFSHIFSMLVLMAAFFVISAATANAQINNRIDATIPFPFTFGENTYPAGDYVIKMQKTGDGIVNLLLENKEGAKLDRVLATENGRTSPSDPALVFDLQSEQRSLTRLAFSDRGYSLYHGNNGREGLSKNKASQAKKRSASME